MNAPDQLPDVDVFAGDRAAVLAALRVAGAPITATAYIDGRDVPVFLDADGWWKFADPSDAEVIAGAD